MNIVFSNKGVINNRIFIWHLIGVAILSTLPILQLYSHNCAQLIFSQLTLPIITIVSGTILLYLILVSFGSSSRASFLASLLIIYGLSFYGLVFRSQQHILGLEHWHLLPLLLVVYGHWYYFVVKLGEEDRKKIVLIVSVMCLPLILFNLFKIGWYEYSSYDAKVQKQQNSIGSSEEIERQKDYPDIYFLLLDEFPNSSTVRNEWNRQTTIDKKLEAQGFFVVDSSRARYSQTDWNVPTLHNLNYITPPVSPDSFLFYVHDRGQIKNTNAKRTLDKLTFKNRVETWNDSRLFRTLKEKGYTIRVVEGVSQHYKSVTHNLADTVLSYKQIIKERGDVFLDDFPKLVLDQSIFQLNDLFSGKEVKKHGNYYGTKFAFDDILRNSESQSTPHMYYYHIMCPHAPYVYSANGDYKVPVRYSKSPGQKYSPKNSPANNDYIEQYDYVVSQLINIVGKLRSSVKDRPSVIIIQGDHGPRPHHLYLDNHLEALSIFNAVYIPNSDYSNLTESTAPVNVIRTILSDIFDLNLDLVDDY